MKFVFGMIAAALLLSSAPAFAQAPPGGVPLGAGFQRGMQEMNNSGQDGYVTLFKEGESTRIVTAIEGTQPGRVQTVAIQRGKACDEIKSGIIAKSTDMVRGMSRGVVHISQDHLTSGNYVVVVYSNNTPSAHIVSCGLLFR
jgi:hypothetical protein